MKRILILADMEGCNGVNSLVNYKDCRDKMVADVDAVVTAICSITDKYHLSIVDCHNTGGTLCEYAESHNIPFYRQVWSIADASVFNLAVMIGFHPAKGNKGRLPHTIRPDIERLLLGASPIGEANLLINWLAYYGINVILVTGDASVQGELTNYYGEFLATHENSRGSYAELTKCLQLALLKEHNIPVYNSEKICLELINEKYLDFLPKEIFRLSNNRVCYNDTKNFIENLPILCSFLNICESFQSRRMRHINDSIQKNNVSIENSLVLQYYLCNKEWRALTDEDIANIYSEIKRMTLQNE